MASDVEPPQLVGDRYRIDSHLFRRTHMDAWVGHDLRLNRAVTIHTMRHDDTPDPVSRALDDGVDGVPARLGTQARITAHLRLAVRVDDPGLTRIYDTLGADLIDPERTSASRIGIVSEPITGDSLDARISSHGPMSLDRARSLIVELAKTVDAIHNQGVVHGGLIAASVGYTGDGRLVISDLGTSGHPEMTSEAVAMDIRALAALLHHLACGRPPHDRGRGYELDPSAPTALAGILTQAFSSEPPWSTAQQFAAALNNDPVITPTVGGGFVSAERKWLVPAIVVVVVASIIGLIGTVASRTSVGRDIIDNAREVVGLDPEPVVTTSTTTLPPPTTDSPLVITEIEILRITDFDPDGNDGEEHPERLALINDSDPTRGWQTETYTTRDFGRLKQGVGLIIELTDATRLTEVTIRSPTRGWAFELYAATDRPLAADWGQPVFAVTNIRSDTVITLDETPATSLLLWITDLGDGPRFTVTITNAEISGIGET